MFNISILLLHAEGILINSGLSLAISFADVKSHVDVDHMMPSSSE